MMDLARPATVHRIQCKAEHQTPERTEPREFGGVAVPPPAGHPPRPDALPGLRRTPCVGLSVALDGTSHGASTPWFRRAMTAAITDAGLRASSGQFQLRSPYKNSWSGRRY